MKAAAYVSLTVAVICFLILVVQFYEDFLDVGLHASYGAAGYPPANPVEYAFFGFVAVAALIASLALFGSAKSRR
jgi:hypothetical protein